MRSHWFGFLLLGVAVLVMARVADDPETRARELLAKMTFEEKMLFVHGSDGQYAGTIPANTRLGIPALHLQDGPQGVGDGTKMQTCWPSALTVTATFDPTLMEKFAGGMAIEQRMKGTNVLLGPMMNIARIPTGGRNFESMGEDPYLAAAMARANVKGIQDQGIIACAKHYADNNQEQDRGTVSATVDERTQYEIYYPAFKASVDAGVGSVMCSYNKVNGTWACENGVTLNVDLKGRMGYKGWVMSDWYATHSTVEAFTAGLDQEMPNDKYLGQALADAINSGLVPRERLDDAVLRMLVPMFAVGLMDRPASGNKDADATSPERSALARSIAAQAIVLLKNDKGLLPLNAAKLSSVAVIGKDASTSPAYTGYGSGFVNAPYVVKPLDAIKARLPAAAKVTYADGSSVSDAVKQAKAAQVAVVCVGMTSGEGSDRKTLALDPADDALVQAVLAAQPNTVVVVHSCGAVLMPWAGAAHALLEAWMPGQEDGHALADVLFGDVNPSGRLPVTFPPNDTAVPASTPIQYPGIGLVETYSEQLLVGYRWYDAMSVAPLFPFGHGLSFTSFAYDNLQVQAVSVGYQVSFDLANNGTRAGAEVAQLYLAYPPAAAEPPKVLRSFRKVYLAPGDRATVSFDVLQAVPDLSTWDEGAHAWAPARGRFTVLVGASSRDIRLAAQLAL